MGTVYLIHFGRPYHHARHYIGYTEDLEAWLDRHYAGNGSKLLKAVREAGIGYEVARTWKGVDRAFKRKIKKQKHASRFCPVCRKERINENAGSTEYK